MNGIFISHNSQDGAMMEVRSVEDEYQTILLDRLDDIKDPRQVEWGIWITHYLAVQI